MPALRTDQRFVAYLRVSTQKQGASGLGIEAQRHAVTAYLGRIPDAVLLQEFVEIESGKNNDRPMLEQAMEHAMLTGATLVIAKMDRLSRNANFLTGLADRGVRFVACDMPEANELVVGIMAQIAQYEVRAISERTKAALLAAKARGTKLGNPKWHLNFAAKSNKASTDSQRRTAQLRAERLRNKLETVRNAGHTTLQAIATEFERQGITTARGGKWHPTAVSRLMNRLNESAG